MRNAASPSTRPRPSSTTPLFVDFYDPAHSYDEHLYIIIGESGRGWLLLLLLVSYAERGGALRLISSREATPAERKVYEEG